MQQFEIEHEKSVGTKLGMVGYPDCGNGRYAAELTYDQWFNLNNWQRVHYNYMEMLTPVLVWILIGCFYKPLAAAILGYVFFIGRLIYSIGYAKSPNSRGLGAIV